MAIMHSDKWPEGDQSGRLYRNAFTLWGGRRAGDMVSMFLRGLIAHTLTYLAEGVQRLPVSQQHGDSYDFHFVFTFPSSWTPEDRQRLKNAVTVLEPEFSGREGIRAFTFEFLAEQEAACLAVMSRDPEVQFQVRPSKFGALCSRGPLLVGVLTI